MSTYKPSNRPAAVKAERKVAKTITRLRASELLNDPNSGWDGGFVPGTSNDLRRFQQASDSADALSGGARWKSSSGGLNKRMNNSYNARKSCSACGGPQRAVPVGTHTRMECTKCGAHT